MQHTSQKYIDIHREGTTKKKRQKEGKTNEGYGQDEGRDRRRHGKRVVENYTGEEDKERNGEGDKRRC